MTYIVRSWTSLSAGAGTNKSVYASFLVDGKWTSEQLHFSSVNPGESKVSETALSNAPSRLKLRLGGVLDVNDAWNFYKIVAYTKVGTTESSIYQELAIHPSGSVGASFADAPQYWLDETPGRDSSKTWVLSAVSELTSGTANMTAGAPTYRSIPASLWMNRSLSTFITGYDILEPIGQEAYPGFVMQAKIEYTLSGQSSPFPCDVNTITVIFQSNVPLLQRCAPIFTLSGLQQVQAGVSYQGGGLNRVATGDIDLEFWSGALQSHITTPINAVTTTGAFDKTAGTLKVNVTSLLNNLNQKSGGQDTLMFTFDVINRYGTYVSNANILKMEYSFRGKGITGTANDAATAAQVNVYGEPRAFLFKSSEELIWSYSIDPQQGFPLSDVSYATSDVRVQPGDAVPLYIRPANFLVQNITQSSPYPCDDNNKITVNLASSVPLDGFCNTTITIRGLTGYVTASNLRIKVDVRTTQETADSKDDIFDGGYGQWRRDEGTVVLNVSRNQVMKAGLVYQFVFTLQNPSRAETTPNDQAVGSSNYANGLTVMASPITLVQTFDNIYSSTTDVYSTATLTPYEAYQIKLHELRPVFIRVIQLQLFVVNQTKPFPCALNQINVGLKLNVPLLGTCKHPAANVYNYTPSVIIRGLTGTTSEDNTVVVTGEAPFAAAPWTKWTRSTGTLEVRPLSKTTAGELYDFSFNVINKAEGQSAPTVSMEITTIENENTGSSNLERKLTDSGYSGLEYSRAPSSTSLHSSEERKPLFIRSAGFYSESTIRQASSHPCADNLITVSLHINVPLYATCGTNITVSGLTGTATRDNYFMQFFATAPASHVALVPRSWDQATGTLIVSAINTDIDDSPDGVNVISFSHMIENRAGSQAAPTLTVRGSFNRSLTEDQEGGWVDGWNDAKNSITGPMTYIVRSWTSLSAGAGTNKSVYASFLVDGKWTSEQLHFSSVNPGESKVSETALSNAPSRLKLRLGGVLDVNDAWNFYKIVAYTKVGTTESSIYQELAIHPSGSVGASFADAPQYWLDETPGRDSSKTWVLSAVSELTSGTANMTAGAPTYRSIPASLWMNRSLSTFITGYDILEPIGQEAYPGFVMQAKIEYTLSGQSSPFPCDVNTITVIFQSNVPLLQRCAPIFTLSGLQQVQAGVSYQGGGLNRVATGDIDLEFWSGALQSHITTPINAVTTTGAFDKTAGTLKVNVTSLLNNLNQKSGGQDTLMFTFDVINRYGTYVSNANILKMEYSFRGKGITGTANDAATAAQVNVYGEPRAFLFKSSEELIWSYSIDPQQGFPLSDVSYATSDVRVQPGDAVPLYIRPANFLVQNITQSSPYPCDDNNKITVNLASSVPLDGFCNTTITIRGLTGYVTASNLRIKVDVRTTQETADSKDDIFDGGYGQWRRDEGTVVLNVSRNQVMKAGLVYQFVFTLQNPSRAETTPNDQAVGSSNYANGLTVMASPITLVQTFDNIYSSTTDVYSTATLTPYEAYQIKLHELRPLYVREMRFVLKTVNQSKPWPCATDNNIIVGFALNVPLLGTCKHPAANVYNVTPSVTILGLVGSESRVDFLAVGSMNNDGPFVTQGQSQNWNRVLGNLRARPMATSNVKTIAGERYFFSFNLWNPAAPSAVPASISIRVDTVLTDAGVELQESADTRVSNREHYTSANFKDLSAEQHPLFIRTPIITASFSQGSRYPCDENKVRRSLAACLLPYFLSAVTVHSCARLPCSDSFENRSLSLCYPTFPFMQTGETLRITQ
jgi:hypothetical protein